MIISSIYQLKIYLKSSYLIIHMYIGPWQEYKLAQVIRFKNDIYEGKNQRLNTQALSMHDNINKTNEKSHISTPSTRSFSSEPVQKPYPKFDIDTYCNQWKKFETNKLLLLGGL